MRIIVLLLIALGLAAFMGVHLKARMGTNHPLTIRFWNGFTGPDGRTILRIVKQFNQQNPDVHVLMQRMDWGTYYNKLFVAGIGNRAPDLFVIHISMLDRFYRAGFTQPLDDLIAATLQFNPGDIHEILWHNVQKQDKVAGLPLDLNLVGMYYNKSLFRQAGIVDAQGEARPPVTREEFVEACRKIRTLNKGANGHSIWGFAFTQFRMSCMSFMMQNEGPFFNKDLTRCLLDDPRNVEMMQFCRDLVKVHKVAPPPENFNSWIGFLQGRIGIVFEGDWMLPDLRKQKDLDFGAAPMPLLAKRWAVSAESHVLCMRTNLDDRQRQAVWRFMQYLSDNGLQWAEAGPIPARRSLVESDCFKRMTEQSQFAKQLKYAELLTNIPFVTEFGTELDLALEKALRGVVPPREALAEAVTHVDQVIERRRQMLANSPKQP